MRLVQRHGHTHAPLASLLLVLLVASMLLLTAWIYWPGIEGPTLLDDRSSLGGLGDLVNRPELAKDYVFGDQSGRLGRPLSMASFVLEKLFLGDSVAISKSVNILLHLLNGVLVIGLVYLLLSTIHLQPAAFLALVAGALWLVSPLYVSTVLYAVQRMAMLAATFVLGSCICYLLWRRSMIRERMRPFWLFLALLFAVSAPFAKENGILVAPILMLMEALWLQFRGPRGEQVRWLARWTNSGLVISVLLLAVWLVVNFDTLVGWYRNRDFTLWERLLTESRILWDYVGQLMWPEVARMGLIHDDVIVSSSLHQPGSTLLSVMAWLCVLALCLTLCFFRTGRYFAFAILFFLVGHSIESTVFPLELYFEHRNYLPGVGLFLGVGLMAGWCVKYWPETSKPLLAWMGMGCLLLSMQTSSQVQIWSSQPLLRVNAVNAHPESFRANIDMATQMASVGDLQSALDYSATAHEFAQKHRANRGEHSGDHDLRDLALSCIAGQPLPRSRIEQIGTDDPERPLGSVATFHAIVQLLQNGTCPALNWLALADRLATLYLAERPLATASPNMYSAMATLENGLARYDKAYEYTSRFLARSPDDVRGLLMQLHFTTALGRESEANSLKARLQSMEQQGKLTLTERETLSLYLET